LREPGHRLIAADADATRAIGTRLAAALLEADTDEPLLIALSGELGAGKTTLVGGFLAALGHAGPVRSPTYSLVEPYRLGDRDVYHCDLYRLRDPGELDDLGLRDLLVARSVLLVEWPERAGDRLRPADLTLVLAYGDEGRTVEITGSSAAGGEVLARLPVMRE
jgi:tRNA threonylcarbamoyladenosine biosynthesis protein TsaE